VTTPDYINRYAPLNIPSPSPAPTLAPGDPTPTPFPTIPFSDLTEQSEESASNLDVYSPESVLALSGSDFVITSLSTGAVRYYLNDGAYQAERILEAPIFRSWRLRDGRFLAIGFELKNPAKRYDMSDLPKSKVLTYTLD
jgi:hypothetical protein